MSVTVDRESGTLAGSDEPQAKPANTQFPNPPDMGRTVHVVGPVINVRPSDTPHPRNSRGELGPVMMSHYRNRLSADPLARVTGGANHAADRRPWRLRATQ